jgi:hypothetical protein
MNGKNIKADLERRVIYADLDNGTQVDLAEIVALEDGFWVVWEWLGRGAMEAWVIRSVADRLDEINFPWARQIEDYFNGIEPQGDLLEYNDDDLPF